MPSNSISTGTTVNTLRPHSPPVSSFLSRPAPRPASGTATRMEDPSDYFDAAADAFLSRHLLSALQKLLRVGYHAASIGGGLWLAKWYFDISRPYTEGNFAVLLLAAVGGLPFILAIPLYGLLLSYLVRRSYKLLASYHPSYRSALSHRDLVPLLFASVLVLLFALAWTSSSSSATPTPSSPFTPYPTSPAPFPLPQQPVDVTALRYELHADVHHTLQFHLADLRRELVSQSQCHAKAVAELQAQVKRLQAELETVQTIQNRTFGATLQHAVDACSVAKFAELAAAAAAWIKLL